MVSDPQDFELKMWLMQLIIDLAIIAQRKMIDQMESFSQQVKALEKQLTLNKDSIN